MNHKLANLLYPNVTETMEDLEARYPKRDLSEGAKVTRLGPSPTGFIHLGNLYGAFADERLAHQSDGKFLLRIEDTDNKRKVEGAEELIIKSLDYFGLHFDEGVMLDGQRGLYGPYRQSERAKIYHVVAKYLVEIGRAYPSFVTEDELEKIREEQKAQKLLTGYYGKWATDRDLSYEEIEARLKEGQPWTLRLRSMGDVNETRIIKDEIRTHVTIHPNNIDVVLLKTDGIPTYHFAHVVDDHFMRVTHVLRGEEWLATLPIHIELFETLGFELPSYCHSTHLMKLDEGTKRKLSKRKDPESALSYYIELGYHPDSVREYMMTLLNSDYEEWRLANPVEPLENFILSLDKMGNTGALLDLEKLDNISKEVLLRKPKEELASFIISWAKDYAPELYPIYDENKVVLKEVLDIGRNGNKPRKDLIYAKQISEFIGYFFDETFKVEDELTEGISKEAAKKILVDYLDFYDETLDNQAWFEKVKAYAEAENYAIKMKEYKKTPELFKGSIADLTSVLRLALTGRQNAPDLWMVQQLLGKEKVKQRLSNYLSTLG